MFTQIRFSNFKSFTDPVEINLRRITVFIGPNGSGKSTALQNLLLWVQTSNQPNIATEGAILNLGTIQDVLGTALTPTATLGFSTSGRVSLAAMSEDNTPITAQSSVDIEFGTNLSRHMLRISSDLFNLDFDEGGKDTESVSATNLKVRRQQGGF